LHVLSNAITKERKSTYTFKDVIEGLKETYKVIKGSYSIVGIMSIDGTDTMFVARDPFGIRPAVWGKKGNSYIAASESVCMDVLEFDDLHSVEPGQVIFFREGEEPIFETIEQKGRKHCVFEYIYFARPDSHINNHSVYRKRMVLGQLLAEEWKERNNSVDIDVIIPIPDTSRISAISFSEKLQIPLREGFIKNRYSGRTFIMPNQGSRTSALRLKLNPIDTEIKGNNVLLIDDSIVRGNTLKRIATTMKNKKAKSIHLAIYSPPVIHPCFYGIDMSTKDELIANKIKEELNIEGNYVSKENLRALEKRLAEFLEVDSLTFLSVSRLRSLFGDKICAACFDGDYPVPITDDIKSCIVNDRCCNRE
jgi:amidophosphoribosyltransferase